jgi:hypothetical protein
MGDLRQSDGTDLTRCSNRSRDVRQSGLCLPSDGNCEGIRATFRDRDLNGDTTAVEGEGQNCRVDYSHLNIRGGALRSREPSSDVASDSGSVPIPVVSTETNYGWSEKVKLAAPVCMGFPGSTEIARKTGSSTPWALRSPA